MPMGGVLFLAFSCAVHPLRPRKRLESGFRDLGAFGYGVRHKPCSPEHIIGAKERACLLFFWCSFAAQLWLCNAYFLSTLRLFRALRPLSVFFLYSPQRLHRVGRRRYSRCFWRRFPSRLLRLAGHERASPKGESYFLSWKGEAGVDGFGWRC